MHRNNVRPFIFWRQIPSPYYYVGGAAVITGLISLTLVQYYELRKGLTDMIVPKTGGLEAIVLNEQRLLPKGSSRSGDEEY